MTDNEATVHIETAQHHRRRYWSILIVAVVIVAAVVALVVTTSHDDNDPLADQPSTTNGLVAFVSGGGMQPGNGDLYVVDPDGTGLRQITATPGDAEYSPVWSADGTRLAYLRSGSFDKGCVCDHAIVVIDPSTGAETFSARLPDVKGALNIVSSSLDWSPDGRSIVLHAYADSITSHIIDLRTGTWHTIVNAAEPVAIKPRWSPDGKWFLVPSPDLLAVPAELIDTTDVVDVAGLPGVRKLTPAASGAIITAAWTPDSSAITISASAAREWHPFVDIITFADGQSHKLVANGFSPAWSPDGQHLAYLDNRERGGEGGAEVWVVAPDGSDRREAGISFIPPKWSPDSTVLVLLDESGLFTVRPDGTGVTRLTPDDLKPEAGKLKWLRAVETFQGSNGAAGDFGPDWQAVRSNPAT